MSIESGDLRSRLVRVALEWQNRYGVAPSVANAISEIDAARLIGMTDDEYAAECLDRTAVTRGFDFRNKGIRYQVKGSRPSGRPGSPVTKVSAPRNYDWDVLIWILYDTEFRPVEAWLWDVESYRAQLAPLAYLRPPHLRGGRRLFPFLAAEND